MPNDATHAVDDAIGLVNILNRVNSGLDLGGSPIGSPTAFSIGVGGIIRREQPRRIDMRIALRGAEGFMAE